MIFRRKGRKGAGSSPGVGAEGGAGDSGGAPAGEAPARVERSEGQWREKLSEEAFRVARKGGTERAFTGRYWNEKRPGTYACVCCGLPLFDAGTKFESGTGWPSFWAPLEPARVEEREDRSFFMRRTEVLCAACDAHLGHVFPDGPDPTGLRYCLNSAALDFRPDPQGNAAPEGDVQSG